MLGSVVIEGDFQCSVHLQRSLWAEFFFILENKLIGYVDDSTLIAVVPSLGGRVRVAKSPNSDPGKVSEWSDLWWMKLNASKTMTIYDDLQITHNASPVTPLTIGGTVLKESDELDILVVIYDSKITFEKYLRSVS